MIKQDSYTKAKESGAEAQKETMRLIDIRLPQSNKVNSNSKDRVERRLDFQPLWESGYPPPNYGWITGP